jgi:hypothetical protein
MKSASKSDLFNQIGRAGRPSLTWVALAVAAACGNYDKSIASPTDMRADRRDDVALIRHEVAPTLTDPAVTLALDPHIAWLASPGHRNGRLFLFLASSRVPPSVSQIVQQEAAWLGYHVIGLSYPNTPGLASFCPVSANPDACYNDVRLQIITGSPATPFVTVNQANSIDNRLAKVLVYLEATFPDEGWSQFLDDEGGIKWTKIAVGGHSQGAGHSAMIAKLRLVDRVVLLSGITDGVGGVASQWVTVGATPPDRYYVLVHARDAQFLAYDIANWTALGLPQFGAPVAPESSQPAYEGTHTFITDVLPQTGNYTAPNPHASTGVDFAVRLDENGVPLLRPVWQYMLGYCPAGGRNGQQSGEERRLVPAC